LINTNNKLKKEKQPPPRLPNITNGYPRFKKPVDKNVDQNGESQPTPKSINNSNSTNNASLKYPRFRAKPMPVKKDNLNDKTNTTIETNKTDMSNDTTVSKPISVKSNNNNEFLKKRTSISHSLDPKLSKSKYPIVPKNRKYILNTRKSFRKSIDVGSKPQTPRTPRKENPFELDHSLEPTNINADKINNTDSSEITANKPIKTKNSYSIKFNRPIKPIRKNNIISNKIVKENVENTSIPADNDTQNEKNTN
jgi:hypothetical protein